MEIKLKRTYDAEEPGDGFRVLVDKLWPRGLSHENFHYDLWEKQLAPSDELRKWFHADPAHRESEFNAGYEKELKQNPALKPFVKEISSYPVVTFLYSSRDKSDNNAIVLRKVVTEMLAAGQ